MTYSDSDGDGVISKDELIEESNYYPFGMQHTGYNCGTLSSNLGQKIKYQGQELQDELGLGWYGFKWRNYNPEIARFMSIDPLSEDYEDYTPYQFASNQPVHAQEVEGLENSHDLNKRLVLRESAPTRNDAIVRTKVSTIALKQSESKKDSNILKLPPVTLQTGYFGQSLDILTTKGIQWVGKKITGENVSAETAQNIQTAVVLFTIVTSKGKNISSLADDVPVVRGGSNTAEAFERGSGVSSRISDKSLDGISVNSSAGKTVEDLSQGIPHNKVGTTTVGEIRKAGGDVVPSPTKGNPNHATMSIPNSKKASEVMQVIKNPTKQ